MHSTTRRKGKSKREPGKKELEKEELKKETESLKKETERMEKEIGELRENSLRQRADFENYQKQLDRDKEEFVKYANEKLIVQLLEVVDNFERALVGLEKNDPESAGGIGMVHNQLMQILEKSGLRRIEAVGKKFDPYYHEAFLQEESDEPEGTVLEELQKGYMLNLRVIRHSKVKVAKAN
jgi:molecular chaperone GrpE